MLGVIAICLWTLFLIQLTYLTNQSVSDQLEHREISKQSSKQTSLNVNMTKINAKNIQDILNNVSEINEKLLLLSNQSVNQSLNK